MVENRADKNQLSSRLMPSQECQLFEGMKEALNMEDNIRSIGSLKFSWSNLCHDGAQWLARLDQLYLFKSHPSSPGCQLLQYQIKGDNTRSDHFLVFAAIQLEDRSRRASNWKMSSTLFEQAQLELIDLWNRQPANGLFFSKLCLVLQHYRMLYKSHAAAI